MLILAYSLETDGEMYIATFDSPVGLHTFIRSLNLTQDAFAVFRGEVLKTFNGRLDLGRLTDAEG